MLAGDEPAQTEFVERIDSMLRNAARCHALYKHLPREQDADDIVNEVWRSVWKSESFRNFSDESHGALRAFMLEVLNRRMIDAARRRGRQPDNVAFESDEALARVEDSHTPSVSAQARVNELMTLVQSALGERDLRLLRGAANGMTAREIADVMELNEDSAQKAMWRAKARARAFFGSL